MTEMGSTSRSTESPSLPAEAERPPGEATSPPNADGARFPLTDGETTIISGRPPIPPLPISEAMSDAATRILQGRILPGDRLGHFDLLQYVGGGGMGRVFRAKTSVWPEPSR